MPKVTFNNKNNVFYSVLKSEVEKYFQQKRLRKTGNWKLYIKSGLLIPLAIALYIFLLFMPMPVLLSVLLCAVLGFVLASIGFNVMHDACHGSFSRHKWINNLFGYTLNALGGNEFFWRQKHNIIHHTYTNIDGMDDDIAKSPLIRQCETQKWLPAHRVQHIYLPLVYAITSIAWTFIMDFVKYFNQKIVTTSIQNMTAKNHFIFWASKVLYVVFYILIPALIVGWQAWIIGFIVVHVVFGFTLAIVFQLAHVVEHTEFDSVEEDPKLIETEWAIHQIKTTANFATHNKIISWFVGGLNFQIEHHLFPRVSHVHYPALSKIVKKVCELHDMPYHQFPSMSSAIISHFRFMRKLGKKPALAMVK
ncbi:MAG TPA: acyl-CoA desaturase [Chitinophagaceae bacterium]|jgi:linoleoyl-CoA desaturase|nr:acyl-CoA desaturase [Chitinophagaceae bacterium]